MKYFYTILLKFLLEIRQNINNGHILKKKSVRKNPKAKGPFFVWTEKFENFHISVKWKKMIIWKPISVQMLVFNKKIEVQFPIWTLLTILLKRLCTRNFLYIFSWRYGLHFCLAWARYQRLFIDTFKFKFYFSPLICLTWPPSWSHFIVVLSYSFSNISKNGFICPFIHHQNLLQKVKFLTFHWYF